jgi:hypothetical protein
LAVLLLRGSIAGGAGVGYLWMQGKVAIGGVEIALTLVCLKSSVKAQTAEPRGKRVDKKNDAAKGNRLIEFGRGSVAVLW